MTGKKYRFDSRHDALIRDRYDSRPRTITDLAKLIGVPRHAIKRRAQQLGVARTKERPWSEFEVRYLEARLHRMSVAVLARRLRRTVTAVALKAKRLGLRKTDEGYTAAALAQALGVDSHRVLSWMRRGMVRATRRHSDRDHDMYYIADAAVRQFVARNPGEVDLRKVDQLWFIDLMMGGLPTQHAGEKDGVERGGGKHADSDSD